MIMFDVFFMKCNNYLFVELYLFKSFVLYFFFLFIVLCNIICELREMDSCVELYDYCFYYD